MSSLSLSAQRSIIDAFDTNEESAHEHVNMCPDQWAAFSLHHNIPYHGRDGDE